MYVQPVSAPPCIHGLRLDVEDAQYRQVSKGKITKMCDFAVIAAQANTTRLIVVELKSGTAYAETIEQLSEGLRVLSDFFQDDSHQVRPAAYLVVGRDAKRLGFLLQDKLSTLKFGFMPVPLTIFKCGAVLEL